MDESSLDTEALEVTENEAAPEVDEEDVNEEDAPDIAEEDTADIDYAQRVEDDLAAIRKEFPTLHGVNDITDLKNPLRFGALRDLGLTVKEAFLASGGARSGYDNRAHLTASVPKRASRGIEMSRKEYEVAKDLFPGLGDSEIKKLYQRAIK